MSFVSRPPPLEPFGNTFRNRDSGLFHLKSKPGLLFLGKFRSSRENLHRQRMRLLPNLHLLKTINPRPPPSAIILPSPLISILRTLGGLSFSPGPRLIQFKITLIVVSGHDGLPAFQEVRGWEW